jgi:hypothetical protein
MFTLFEKQFGDRNRFGLETLNEIEKFIGKRID